MPTLLFELGNFSQSHFKPHSDTHPYLCSQKIGNTWQPIHAFKLPPFQSSPSQMELATVAVYVHTATLNTPVWTSTFGMSTSR